jgi:signal transduction histidine kinase
LGLAIVRKIIELHEGRINIFSGPEKGTTIMVSLPGSQYDVLSTSRETGFLSNVMA